jgi:hypothetical protein
MELILRTAATTSSTREISRIKNITFKGLLVNNVFITDDYI